MPLRRCALLSRWQSSLRGAELNPICFPHAFQEDRIESGQYRLIECLPECVEFLQTAGIACVRQVSRIALRHEPYEVAGILRRELEQLTLLGSDRDAKGGVIALHDGASHSGQLRS